jgi:flagellar protein FliL
LKAWLPLIAAVVTMPALAYATTHFVLLPKLERDLALKPSGAAKEAASESTADGKDKAGASKLKVSVSLSKILVNVAGTMGTRYLMTSVTLVGNTPDFSNKIEENKAQLMDLANGTLATKTISDLEKPGARNVIRAELMTVFNNALGGPLLQEIYITELAIQ